jgi:hypothetical protein
MNIEIFDITAIEQGVYRIAFRRSGAVSSYIVKLTEDPVPGISGPHSLWDLLGGNKEATGKLMAVLLEMHRTGSTNLPTQLSLEENGSKLNSTGVGYWSALSAWSLSQESISWASKHLITRGNNTLFPIPFEHQVIEGQLDDFAEKIQNINVCEHTMIAFRQLLAPKSAAGVRLATQLDPLDAMVLTAIVYELGELIERARVPVSEGIVFSFRFNPSIDGRLWDTDTNYNAFQERTRELLLGGDASVVAETDVSTFYHSLSPSLITMHLERLGVKRKHASALCNFLQSSRIDGIPVGPSASALLAEAVLIPVDLQLISRGARFVRFNDDYRFFCQSDAEAQSLLQVLADALWRTAGLTMQESKTRISNKEDYWKKLEETWLKQLYADDETPSEDFDRKLNSARSVLEQSVDATHVAWIRLCRESFLALPLEDKKAVLPLLLEQLARVWGIAPQVSRSLEALLASSDGGHDLLKLVWHRLKNQPSSLPDYAMSWILHAFWRSEWKGKEILTFLDAELSDTQCAARRELLIALRGTAAAGTVGHDQNDPWQNRAHVWATRDLREAQPPREGSDQRVGWVQALYEALAHNPR